MSLNQQKAEVMTATQENKPIIYQGKCTEAQTRIMDIFHRTLQATREKMFYPKERGIL